MNASLVSGLSAPAGHCRVRVGPVCHEYRHNGTIGEYTTSGARREPSLVSGLSGPDGIAVSGSNLFVANRNTGTIGEYTTSGGTVNASLVLRVELAVGRCLADRPFVTNTPPVTIGEYYQTSGATVNLPSRG